MSEFTKCSEVFDRSKVGVGDIVEFNMYNLPLFKRQEVIGRRVGIVVKVEAEDITLKTQDDYMTRHITEHIIHVRNSDQLRMVYRSPYNEKEDE